MRQAWLVGVWPATVALLLLLHIVVDTNCLHVYSKRYSESQGVTQDVAQDVAVGQDVTQRASADDDEDYDSTEVDDDERVYKNPRKSPSPECPRDEEHANFLGQNCSRKCSTDEDCKSKRKKCRCDTLCGMSCIKPDRICDEVLFPPLQGNVTVTGRFFGDTATYTCDPRFHLVGLRVRTCRADGKWSGQMPTCKQNVYCRSPPPLDHARHNALQAQTTFDVGTTLQYRCHQGYVTNGFITAKCFAVAGTASWYGPDISCEPRACGQPMDPENGWHKASCYTYTCRASYECAKDYELVGRAERTCQADGTWSPKDLPSCVQVECPIPEHPVNGKATYSSTAYNAIVSYTCNYGYSLVGDSTRRCGADKRWSGHKPNCQEINCGDPGPLYNGWMENIENGTGLGASVIFRCRDTMRLEGATSSLCQIDGKWRYPPPRCLAPCVVPSIINGTVWPKGIMTNSTDDGSSRGLGGPITVPHGEQLMVRCEFRYEFLSNGSPVLCNNGTWTLIPKCQPARCKRMPKAPLNGIVIAPKTDHGMRAKFACRDGYSLTGSEVAECSYGNWTGELPYCKEVFCQYPGSVENGKVMLVGNMGLYDYRPYVTKVANNKQIMYDCDRGYVLQEGPPGATCIGGKWSPRQLPKCVPGKHPRLRWSRSVRATLFAARLKLRAMVREARSATPSQANPEDNHLHSLLPMEPVPRKENASESNNNENNSLIRPEGHARSYSSPPAVKFQPWGAPTRNHDEIEERPMAPSPSRGTLEHLLGKTGSSSARTVDTSMPIAGDPDQHYADDHALYGRPGPATNGATGLTPQVRAVRWFTADGRSRKQVREERARRSALGQHSGDYDEEEDEEEEQESGSESAARSCGEESHSQSSSCSQQSSEETSGSSENPGSTPDASTSSPRVNSKNETILSRQPRASRTRVGPQVMRANNRHRGGDRRKSTKTRKDSSKKTSPGNTLNCDPLSTESHTTVVVTKPGRDYNDSASSGAAVQVSCAEGYHLSIGTNVTAKCTRGRWKPGRPECVPVACIIPDTDHGIYRRVNDSELLIEDAELTHDEEVKFTCIIGYYSMGPTRLRCIHGEWDVQQFPSCEPGKDAHSEGVGDVDIFGEVDKGDRRSCNPPAKVQGSLVYVNGQEMREPEGSFPDGTEVVFNCMASIQGGKSTWRIICDDGKWVGRELNCDMLNTTHLHPDNQTCTLRSSEPNVVSFYNDQLITVNVVDLPPGAVVVSRCQDIGKYQLIGSSHRRCVAGEWDGQKPVCFGLNQENDYALEKPPTVLFRHQLGPIAQSNDGKLIVYPGVILHMECLWIRRFGTPKWTVNHNYSSVDNTTETPQKVYPTGWSTEEGRDSALEYRLSILHASKDDSGEFTCTTPTRHTHSIIVEVKAVHCPKLPEKNGLVYSTTETKMNTRVVMSCPNGNSLIGASEVVCLASGNWSAQFPVCESVECPDFGNAIAPNLRVSILSRGVGGQAVFSCPTGYGLTGPSHTVCQHNGDWATPYPSCAEVSCEDPGAPERGFALGSPPFPATSILHFSCEEGYMIDGGQALLTCRDNGRWSGPVPKCIQACTYPGNVVFGRMSEVKFHFKIGENVTFTCDKGKEMRGAAMLHCQRSGKWSSGPPQCVDPDQGAKGALTSGENIRSPTDTPGSEPTSSNGTKNQARRTNKTV